MRQRWAARMDQRSQGETTMAAQQQVVRVKVPQGATVGSTVRAGSEAAAAAAARQPRWLQGTASAMVSRSITGVSTTPTKWREESWGCLPVVHRRCCRSWRGSRRSRRTHEPYVLEILLSMLTAADVCALFYRGACL